MEYRHSDTSLLLNTYFEHLMCVQLCDECPRQHEWYMGKQEATDSLLKQLSLLTEEQVTGEKDTAAKYNKCYDRRMEDTMGRYRIISMENPFIKNAHALHYWWSNSVLSLSERGV